jgi:hypothetical protein
MRLWRQPLQRLFEATSVTQIVDRLLRLVLGEAAVQKI